jgi:hypothetical protein
MTHDSILRSLDEQSVAIERKISSEDDVDRLFVLGLELNKMITNMDHARGLILELEGSGSGTVSESSRPLLKRINQRLQLAQHKVQTRQEQETREYHKEQERKQKLSVIESEPGLRNRRLSTADGIANIKQPKSTSADLSLNDKLSVQQTVQEDLSHDILGMVSKIKSNAIALSEKMATDADVVRSTGEALNRTSSSMEKVGSRLNKYHKTGALGWRFYIMAVVFLIVAVFAGMTIIRLFPKW